METKGWNDARGTAYGRALMDLNKYVRDLKPARFDPWRLAGQVMSTPQAALTSVHFSAPFVQLWGMMSTKYWPQAFLKMWQYFSDAENYKDFQGWMQGHPLQAAAKDGGLGMTGIKDLPLSQMEEDFQSNLLAKGGEWLKEKYGIPNFPAAASRAFVGAINYVRFNRFVDGVHMAEMAGEDVSLGSPVLKDIAKAVNDFSGRGNLGPGDMFKSSQPLLNAALWAPRKLAGTIEMFDPVSFLDPRVSATARMMRVRQLVGSLGITMGIIGMARMAGAKVDLDPTDTEFGMIRIGPFSYDITGGNAKYIRLVARLVMGVESNAAGKIKQLGYNNNDTRMGLLLKFMRGKLAPAAAFFTDMFVGKDPVGRPFSLGQEAQDKFTPIALQSFLNLMETDPKNWIYTYGALPALIGVGVETKPYRDLGLGSGPAEREMSRLNFSDYDLPHPSGDPQFDKVVLDKLGPLVNTTLASFVQSPGYQRMGDPQRALSLQQVLRGLERAAKGQAIAADPQAYAKIRAAKVNPRLQAVIAPQPAEAE